LIRERDGPAIVHLSLKQRRRSFPIFAARNESICEGDVCQRFMYFGQGAEVHHDASYRAGRVSLSSQPMVFVLVAIHFRFDVQHFSAYRLCSSLEGLEAGSS
jgi:hypothetical protein